MEEKKYLTLNGLTPLNFLYLCLSIAMIFAGSYLTGHYFDLVYPTTITGASTFCNINDFFGCDKTALSPLGSVAGVPTSIFGIAMGLIGVISVFMGSKKLEKTTKTILLINLAGCLILLIYSLVVLKSLCPMCSAYYLLSGLSYFLFHKYSQASLGIDPTYAGVCAAIFIVPAIALNIYTSQKIEEKNALASGYITQFKNLKDYGEPIIESEYKIHMATQNFSDAPLRVSVFSDFQCPYCKAVAEQLSKLIKEFRNKINIQYMFYPLDPSCNKEMKGGLHAHACAAAYLAACEKEKFVDVHDYIFEHQNEISSSNLKLWAKKFQIDAKCLFKKEVQDKIQQTLNAGKQYKLRSTPTMIINGKKLEGMIPTVHLKSILNSLIK